MSLSAIATAGNAPHPLRADPAPASLDTCDARDVEPMSAGHRAGVAIDLIAPCATDSVNAAQRVSPPDPGLLDDAVRVVEGAQGDRVAGVQGAKKRADKIQGVHTVPTFISCSRGPTPARSSRLPPRGRSAPSPLDDARGDPELVEGSLRSEL